MAWYKKVPPICDNCSKNIVGKTMRVRTTNQFGTKVQGTVCSRECAVEWAKDVKGD